jgi:competence protein ComGC
VTIKTREASNHRGEKDEVNMMQKHCGNYSIQSEEVGTLTTLTQKGVVLLRAYAKYLSGMI